MIAPTIMIPPEADRQVRIGLVFYGGVALAIYEYGVALEFLRLVQASNGVEDNAYTKVIGGAKAKAVVDIISGTSAGGINGVALAKALTQNLGMNGLRDTWVYQGDLLKLMNPPYRLNAKSLLDERKYEKAVSDALTGMNNERNEDSKLESLVDVLDLWVTTTNLHGRRGVLTDFLGNSVHTRQHGKLFHRKFRVKGYNPSDPELGYNLNDFKDRDQLLVKICRATSAFPFAFRPVELSSQGGTAELLNADEGEVVYCSDGGILNNKPFTSTIKTIFSRAASHKVDRVLFFVEPDPGTSKRKEVPNEPDAIGVLSKATTEIPRHDSIVADLKAIDEHNEHVAEFKKLIPGLESIIRNQFSQADGLDTKPYRDFLAKKPQFRSYRQLKYRRLRKRLMANVESVWGQSEDISKAFSQELDDRLPDNEMNADREADFVRAFDIEFRIRKYYRLIEILGRAYDQDSLSEEVRTKVASLEQDLWALLNRTRHYEWCAWNEEFADEREAVRSAPPDQLRGQANAFLTKLQGYLDTKLGNIRQHGLQTAQKTDETIPKASASELTLLGGKRVFERLFTRFEVVDMILYPAIDAADLGERDPVEVVRLSPVDARYIQVAARDKLAGETLAHFGGFLKSEWRENDIMWGRLDAAEIITRTILKCADVTPQEEVNPLVHKVQAEIARKELKSNGGDYKAYLEGQHDPVGREGPRSLGVVRWVRLIAQAAPVVANMLISRIVGGIRDLFR